MVCGKNHSNWSITAGSGYLDLRWAFAGIRPAGSVWSKRNDESTCCERQNGYFLDACLGYCPTALWSVSYFEKGELLYNGSVDELLAQNPDLSLEAIYLKMTGRGAEEPSLIENGGEFRWTSDSYWRWQASIFGTPIRKSQIKPVKRKKRDTIDSLFDPTICIIRFRF